MPATAQKIESTFKRYVPVWEQPVVRLLVKTLLEKGFTVSVNDGEETTVVRSDHFQTIIDALGSSGEDYIFFQDPKQTVKGDNGFFFLIYDNGSAPDDQMIVICDYSATEESDEIYNVVQAKYGE